MTEMKSRPHLLSIHPQFSHMASKWKRWASCLFSRSSAFCNTQTIKARYMLYNVMVLIAGRRIRVLHVNLASELNANTTQWLLMHW